MSIQLVEMNIDGSEGRIYNIDHDNVVIGRYLFTPKSFGKLLTFPSLEIKVATFESSSLPFRDNMQKYHLMKIGM
jgi:hypothetical protein